MLRSAARLLSRTLRELGKSIREDERLMPSLLPVGDGLLAAVKK